MFEYEYRLLRVWFLLKAEWGEVRRVKNELMTLISIKNYHTLSLRVNVLISNVISFSHAASANWKGVLLSMLIASILAPWSIKSFIISLSLSKNAACKAVFHFSHLTLTSIFLTYNKASTILCILNFTASYKQVLPSRFNLFTTSYDISATFSMIFLKSLLNMAFCNCAYVKCYSSTTL